MSSERWCLMSCRHFGPELAAAARAEAGEELEVVAFPARCGRPPLDWAEVRALLPPDCRGAVLFGRACLQGLGPPPTDLPPLRLVPQEQCFHLVAPAGLVAEALGRGAYLLTPGWLSDWRGELAALGLDPDQGREFFQDFARELVLLDTGVLPEAPARFEELRAALGLPATRVPVGLDSARLAVARLLGAWRLEQEQARARDAEADHRRELADRVAAMDLLARLARTHQEDQVIAGIQDLCRMLFGPEDWYYLRFEGGVPVPDPGLPVAWWARMAGLEQDYAWQPSGQGFLIRIADEAQTLGVLALDRLAFPAYRERYLNLALALTGVLALAIGNARARRRLVEAEKMASLGVLVAGVAHEINTPVGVGLAAVTSLHGEAQRLAERFAARTLAPSQLGAYLAQAETAAGLIQTNLERIGDLVDSFRRLAVTHQPLAPQRFRWRGCLEEALASLGDQWPRDRLAVAIEGDGDLEIDSYPSVWASILTNLLTNSLYHGFGDRQGQVRIGLGGADGRLWLDYRDDGRGMDAGVLARVFEPFFTTNRQRGMGLGLHLVYNLVTQRLGGTIGCTSQPGQGVHFHLEVPR